MASRNDAPSMEALLDDLVSMQCIDKDEDADVHAAKDDGEPAYPDAMETALARITESDLTGLRSWLRANPTWNVNTRSVATGRSLLHHASTNGHKDAVKVLLEETESSLTLRTMLGGCSALHLAVQNNHRSIVFQLLSHGADALARDKFGRSPMHYVKSVSVAKLLVQYQARVIDYDAKQRNAMETVLALQALNAHGAVKEDGEDDGQPECADANTLAQRQELMNYLKWQAEVEYKAKLMRLRELKHKTKGTSTEPTAKVSRRRTLKDT